jgi:2-oxoglutarate dehydrogenase E1 component
MGPEHSSARIERFLALAAEDNIQIVVPTTPAQYFHCLRRQALRRWRKPLVVMTPKSLLRHPSSVSTLDDLASGRFERVLPDALKDRQTPVTRVLMCSGKIYLELVREREKRRRFDVAILRLEQLYPLREDVLEQALRPYADGVPVFWVQEEPANMGAWVYLRALYGFILFGRLPFQGITRQASCSPATGSHSCHQREQEQLLESAFGG